MKRTIAEMRREEVQKLHEINPAAGYDTAARLMNSFYRLCGLAERNLYLANDERTQALKSTQKSEDREEKWYKRLSGEFEKNYGLTLKYCSYRPSIGVEMSGKGFSEKIYRYFYQ